MFATYFHAELESTTEEVTDATDIGSTELGTTESMTTEISSTEGMIHVGVVRRLIVVLATYFFFYINTVNASFGFDSTFFDLFYSAPESTTF